MASRVKGTERRHVVADRGVATLDDLNAPVPDRHVKTVYAARIVRTDPVKRIVYGEVYVPFDPVEGKTYSVDDINKFVDTWGTFMTRATLEDLAHQFCAFRGYIDRMHDRRTNAGQMVESFIVREGDLEFTPGAWVMAAKITDDKVWAEVQAGVLTGFSIDILAARSPHMIQVEGQGEVPDLMGVNQPPFPAQDRQVNGSAMLRLDELQDTMPFFVSIVDSAANRREFEKRRAAETVAKETEMAIKKAAKPNAQRTEDPVATVVTDPPAVVTPPVAEPAVVTPPAEPAATVVDPPAPPAVVATEPPAAVVTDPPVATPPAEPAQRQMAVAGVSPMSELGSSIDFAEQWGMGDLAEDMMQANCLLSDTLWSIQYLANELTDPKAMLQKIVDTLNQYASAVKGMLLGGAGGDEQRAKALGTKRIAALRAANLTATDAMTMRVSAQLAAQFLRVGKKVSAKNVDHLNAAMGHIGEILKDAIDAGAGGDDDEGDDPAGATGDAPAAQTPVAAGKDAAGKDDPNPAEPDSTAKPSTVDANATQTTGEQPDDKKPKGDDERTTQGDGQMDEQSKAILEAVKTLIDKVDALDGKIAGADAPADQGAGADDAEGQKREGAGLPVATEGNTGNMPTAPKELPVIVDATAGKVNAGGGSSTVDPAASEGNVYSRSKLHRMQGNSFNPLFGVKQDPTKRKQTTTPAMATVYAAPAAAPAVVAPPAPAQRAAEPAVVATEPPAAVVTDPPVATPPVAATGMAELTELVRGIAVRVDGLATRVDTRLSKIENARRGSQQVTEPATPPATVPAQRSKEGGVFKGALGFSSAPVKK